MPDTFIVDMRHYLDEFGGLADLPNPALRLALYFGSIVAWMSNQSDEGPMATNVVCRRSPGRSPCVAEIQASFEPAEGGPAIAWFCPFCGDQGVISGWQDTPWDRGKWRRGPCSPGRGRDLG